MTMKPPTDFLNARNTLLALLELGIIPIINENDTVVVDEIKFGDNDNLSALITNLIGADLLIILTDIDGLCDSGPRVNPHARYPSGGRNQCGYGGDRRGDERQSAWEE